MEAAQVTHNVDTLGMLFHPFPSLSALTEQLACGHQQVLHFGYSAHFGANLSVSSVGTDGKILAFHGVRCVSDGL